MSMGHRYQLSGVRCTVGGEPYLQIVDAVAGKLWGLIPYGARTDADHAASYRDALAATGGMNAGGMLALTWHEKRDVLIDVGLTIEAFWSLDEKTQQRVRDGFHVHHETQGWGAHSRLSLEDAIESAWLIYITRRSHQ